MRIPDAARVRLLGYAQGVMGSRKADVIIGDGYVERWMLYPKNRWRNIYIHRFNRSDDDGALHDHEPDNCSLILQGQYLEHFHVRPRMETLHWDEDGNMSRRFLTYVEERLEGDVVFRLAGTPHRVELRDNQPVITMFLQGPRRRKWGFHCTSGFVPWDKYIDERKGYGDRSGKGCPP